MEVKDPRNIRLASKIQKAVSLQSDVILAKAKEVLNWYASDQECKNDLSRSGIILSVVQESMKFAIPNFHPTIQFGFPKFIEYMQFVCKQTQLCVVRPQNNQAVLRFRDSVRKGVEILPDLDAQDLHTVEGYRSLLATGNSTFRFPQANEMQAVTTWIIQHPPEAMDLGSMIEKTVTGLNGLVSSESVKRALLCLVSAEAFDRQPEGMSLSEQNLTLRSDVCSSSALRDRLLKAAKEKLVMVLGQVKDDIIENVL
ncbi:MAG: hypothetical protein E3K32_03450 [wastewater metagenome]|nr:hypothetical protein [Candidatus Loosdrechtia aerotolerans]